MIMDLMAYSKATMTFLQNRSVSIVCKPLCALQNLIVYQCNALFGG